jgi:hypothetical protein
MTTDTYESTLTRYYDLLNAAKQALAVLAEHEKYARAADGLRFEIEREGKAYNDRHATPLERGITRN